MLELVLLGVFAGGLLGCVFSGLSILYAMVFGLLLFSGYALRCRHTLPQVLHMAFSGVRTVRNILLTFILIGVITAFWRAGGTIPFIVYYAADFCASSVIFLLSFWLCCLISVLTGTAFGSAATMGVICMTMAVSMGADPLYAGGAILSGVFFGDRCSPMSTSALLVSTLTGTNIYRNIGNMIRSAAVPFILTSLFYFVLGWSQAFGGEAAAVQDIFAAHFNLHPYAVFPAIVVVLLSLVRLDVKRTMLLSILSGIPAMLWLQQLPPTELLSIAVWGYHPPDAALAALLGGGGIISMVTVFAIVCISSCYAGIFAATGFLKNIQQQIAAISARITPFGGILLTSVLTSMVACNQTLAVMLTHQLCGPLEPQPERLALQLEDSVVLISALIPWSIAGAVPLAAVAAPTASIIAAVYLYLVPLWSFYRMQKTRAAI